VSLYWRADVVDALPVGLVLFFQPFDTIESASAACPQLFRINPDEFVGLNGLELVRTGDHERVHMWSGIGHFHAGRIMVIRVLLLSGKGSRGRCRC